MKRGRGSEKTKAERKELLQGFKFRSLLSKQDGQAFFDLPTQAELSLQP